MPNIISCKLKFIVSNFISSAYFIFLRIKEKEQLGNYTEQSFACITQPETKERLSEARCVSFQEKKKKKEMLSVKKQPHPDAWSSGASAAGRLKHLNM